jgi:hypothetical protein
MLISSFSLNLKKWCHRYSLVLFIPLHTLRNDREDLLRTKLYDKRDDDFNFPIVNFQFLCRHIPAGDAYGVYYIYLSWNNIPIRKSLIEGCYQQGSNWTQCSLWVGWREHFERYTIDIMTWLILNEFQRYRWPRICSVCRNKISAFPFSFHFHFKHILFINKWNGLDSRQ